MWGHCYINFSLKPQTIGLALDLILESELCVLYLNQVPSSQLKTGLFPWLQGNMWPTEMIKESQCHCTQRSDLCWYEGRGEDQDFADVRPKYSHASLCLALGDPSVRREFYPSRAPHE